MRSWLLSLDSRFSWLSNLTDHSKLAHASAAVIAHSADSWFWLAGLILLWWLGPESWRPSLLVLGIGILVTAVLVMLIKFTVRRSRPVGNWGKIYRSTDPHSFPSGHAARSFMIAVLMLGLGPIWLGVLLLFWAMLVGLARISLGVHYPSDVIAGDFLGVLIGILILVFV